MHHMAPLRQAQCAFASLAAIVIACVALTAFVNAGQVVLVDETEQVLGSDMPEVRAYLGN